MKRVSTFYPKMKKDHRSSPSTTKECPFFHGIMRRKLQLFQLVGQTGRNIIYHLLIYLDDTEEPIFPRNDHNKPIVPTDSKGLFSVVIPFILNIFLGQPIFPTDKSGTFIFPLDESHCPIPALTTEGHDQYTIHKCISISSPISV